MEARLPLVERMGRMLLKGDEAADAVSEPDKALTETFRLLALDIERLMGAERRRAVAVLSAWPKDGRSLVAGYLARALCETIPRVLLVDADPNGSGLNGVPVRAPGIYNPEPRWQGLATPALLIPTRDGERARPAFVQEVTLAVEHAWEQDATVVIDTPASTVSSAAFSMAVLAGSVLYVARRRSHRADVHRDIRAQLDLMNVNLLGVVFNEG